MAKDTTRPQSTQTAAAETAAPPAAERFPAALLGMFGNAQYTHESSITLYPDKRKPGVKNGRAGYVALAIGRNAIVKCSVYMDAEPIDQNGEKKTKKTFRLSVPKGVSLMFADAAEEKRFKNAHVTLWAEARKAKIATSDASDDAGGFTEID